MKMNSKKQLDQYRVCGLIHSANAVAIKDLNDMSVIIIRFQ